MLRCFACHRPLIRYAVPGLAIGPKCAKNRDLLPSRDRPLRIITPGRQFEDPRQADWVNESERFALDVDAARSIIMEAIYIQGPDDIQS